MYFVEFYSGTHHVGTRSLVATTLSAALVEASYLIKQSVNADRLGIFDTGANYSDDVELVVELRKVGA